MPDPDVLLARLDALREDVGELREDIRLAVQNTVPRGEWAQRNEHVDTRLNGLGREVGDLRLQLTSRVNELRTEVNARRAPWWSVATVVLSAGAVAWSVLGPAIVPAQ